MNKWFVEVFMPSIGEAYCLFEKGGGALYHRGVR